MVRRKIPDGHDAEGICSGGAGRYPFGGRGWKAGDGMSTTKKQAATQADRKPLAINSGIAVVRTTADRALTSDERRLVAAYRNLHDDVQRFMLNGMEKLEADPITARPKAAALRLVGVDHA
jgi:hypothetical protein